MRADAGNAAMPEIELAHKARDGVTSRRGDGRMSNGGEALGALFGLALLAGLIGFGVLLATSKAVLFYEAKVVTALSVGYECHYFTGTRSIVEFNNSHTGCKRFIDVGS